MPEILLHYIWLKGLFKDFPQFTTDGRRVEVLSTGRHNLDAGPDFTNVHLKIDGIELIGQVEIHVESSDWYQHHHDLDPAYNNVLLHVVRHANKPIYSTTNHLIPQLELRYNEDKDYIDGMLHDAMEMDSAVATHQCARRLMEDPTLLTEHWKNAMLHRRLQCKTESIQRLLNISHNDWREAFYISLAHAFGFHVNGIPMELMALSTPLHILAKHRNNPQQLEAILLGQAGLLQPDDTLYKEYTFLRAKFSLTPIDTTLWKQGRIRPQNRPTLRIQQLAMMIHSCESLLSQCMETEDVTRLHMLFAPAKMGTDSMNSLLINVVAPYLYARGHKTKAIDLLQHLPKEDNRIIRQWKSLGQSVHSAADTQALIHLYQTCCEQGQCMQCAVWSESR